MKKYIILLCGINVSGKNKIPMAELRELLNNLGFKNVQTYIQSGNSILESNKNKQVICTEIKHGILDMFGLDVPVLAKSIQELEHVISKYPFSLENEKIAAFTFLNKPVKKQC